MPPRVKSIEIRAFRGIPDLDIPLHGKSLLVGGENGTGKSSIVEAFEYFFTGSISHLEGTRGLAFQKHAPHVQHSVDDLSVAIVFDPGKVRMERTVQLTPSPPPQLQQYFETAQAGSFILRRAQILEFIGSKPAERFRALASIIGVDSLDEIELEMMRVRDDLQGEIDAQASELERLFRALSDDLEAPVESIEDVLPALNALLDAANLPKIESLERVGTHAESMLRSVKSASSVEAVSSLNAILSNATDPLLSPDLLLSLEQLNNGVTPLVEEGARLEMRLAEFLQTGQAMVEAEDLNQCPFCQQPIVPDTLLAQVTARLNRLQALSGRAAKIRSQAAKLASEIRQAKN